MPTYCLALLHIIIRQQNERACENVFAPTHLFRLILLYSCYQLHPTPVTHPTLPTHINSAPVNVKPAATTTAALFLAAGTTGLWAVSTSNLRPATFYVWAWLSATVFRMLLVFMLGWTSLLILLLNIYHFKVRDVPCAPPHLSSQQALYFIAEYVHSFVPSSVGGLRTKCVRVRPYCARWRTQTPRKGD